MKHYNTLSKDNLFQLDWRNGCGGEDGCGDAKKVTVLLLEEQANKQKYKEIENTKKRHRKKENITGKYENIRLRNLKYWKYRQANRNIFNRKYEKYKVLEQCQNRKTNKKI